MAERTSAAIFMLVPVICQVEHRLFELARLIEIIGGCKKNQRKATRLIIEATCFRHAHFITKEIKGCIEITNPDHRMQIFHCLPPDLCAQLAVLCASLQAQLSLFRDICLQEID